MAGSQNHNLFITDHASNSCLMLDYVHVINFCIIIIIIIQGGPKKKPDCF